MQWSSLLRARNCASGSEVSRHMPGLQASDLPLSSGRHRLRKMRAQVRCEVCISLVLNHRFGYCRLWVQFCPVPRMDEVMVRRRAEANTVHRTLKDSPTWHGPAKYDLYFSLEGIGFFSVFVELSAQSELVFAAIAADCKRLPCGLRAAGGLSVLFGNISAVLPSVSFAGRTRKSISWRKIARRPFA